MPIGINEESLFCDYYSQWISVYKEGAIREVTMGKYRLTQSWLAKLIPDLKIKDLDLCQDFGHGSLRNQAAIGMASGLGAVLSKKAAMASAGTL